MSPRVKPRPAPHRPSSLSSFAEYRRVKDHLLERMPAAEQLRSAGASDITERAFWRYVTSAHGVTGDPLATLETVERRALSKSTSAAGGYLVPSDFDDQITTLRRAGSIIGAR